jgi:lysophospholipase L1-like esterase
MLGSGISVWGSPQRLKAKLRQALDGQIIHIYFMGGSISYCHRVVNEQCWVYRVQDWFRGAYPGLVNFHNAAVPATSSAFAAACMDQVVDKVSTICCCPAAWVPGAITAHDGHGRLMGAQDADLVFLEYTINDMLFWGDTLQDEFRKVETNMRRGFERLLRKLLQYERMPAVIIVHAWSPEVTRRWFHVEQHDFFRYTPEDIIDFVGK